MVTDNNIEVTKGRGRGGRQGQRGQMYGNER